MRTKVIIDTDAGLDDALAIFMALEAHKRGEVEVLAITTVQGNTSVRNVNVNVQRILHTAGLMEIPVYSGACKSMVKPWQHPKEPFHGHNGFGDIPLPPLDPPAATLQPQHAVWAILNIVKKYPDGIVLVALGPLTNLALAMRLDPSFTSNLLDIYVMGGNTTGEGNVSISAEFNFMCDAEAARVVLEETTIPIHLTPWEACLYAVSTPLSLRIKMGQSKTKTAELMNKIEANILEKKEYENWVTCDQLAMAWMIDDVKNGKLQKFQKGNNKDESSKKTGDNCLVTASKMCYASVELCGDMVRGQMVIDHRNQLQRPPNLIIMSSINNPYYIRYLRMAFTGHF